MVVIKTEARFETAHRQIGDASKCGRLHGHNWVVVFLIEGDVNEDSVGYLIDFKELKNLTDCYDHTVLLHKDDPLVGILRTAGQIVIAMDGNPTAEYLAKDISWRVMEILAERKIVWASIEVTVWENEKSGASIKIPRSS